MDLAFKTGAPGREQFDAIDASRQACGLSVDRLCRAADISGDTYRRLMSNPRRIPNFRTVRALRRALDDIGAAQHG